MRNPISLAGALAAAALLLLSGASASAGTITFSGLAHGDIVGTIGNVTFNIDNDGGGPDLGVIFDTERSSDPNDGDLLRFGSGPDQNLGAWKDGNLPSDTVLGNALIIQENSTGCATNNDCDDPDDEAGGGVIEMVFATSVLSVGLDVIDVDDNEGNGGLTFWDGATSVFFSWTSLVGAGNLDNNSANRIAPIGIGHSDLVAAGFTGIDRVEVEFIHSGAIDNIQVPEPGTLLLLGTGLAGLAAAGRRRLH